MSEVVPESVAVMDLKNHKWMTTVLKENKSSLCMWACELMTQLILEVERLNGRVEHYDRLQRIESDLLRHEGVSDEH